MTDESISAIRYYCTRGDKEARWTIAKNRLTLRETAQILLSLRRLNSLGRRLGQRFPESLSLDAPVKVAEGAPERAKAPVKSDHSREAAQIVLKKEENPSGFTHRIRIYQADYGNGVWIPYWRSTLQTFLNKVAPKSDPRLPLDAKERDQIWQKRHLVSLIEECSLADVQSHIDKLLSAGAVPELNRQFSTAEEIGPSEANSLLLALQFEVSEACKQEQAINRHFGIN